MVKVSKEWRQAVDELLDVIAQPKARSTTKKVTVFADSR